MSFTGEFRHTVDAKGRLIVPSRMRDELEGGRVVLSTWLDGCIALWSEQGWGEIEAKLRAQRSSDRNSRAFVRRLASSAHQDVVDRQGRITIPSKLRDEAGITRDVVVAGVMNRAEIWAPERWDAHLSTEAEGRLEELAEGLDDF